MHACMCIYVRAWLTACMGYTAYYYQYSLQHIIRLQIEKCNGIIIIDTHRTHACTVHLEAGQGVLMLSYQIIQLAVKCMNIYFQEGLDEIHCRLSGSIHIGVTCNKIPRIS